MISGRVLRLLLLLFTGTFPILNTQARNTFDEKHTEVVMRMIGHRILLSSGDSSSRVLPVKRNDNRFTIEFEAPFSFDPDELIDIVNSELGKSGVSDTYILEVIRTQTDEVVYSYLKDGTDKRDVIPCRSRDQHLDNYHVVLTFSDGDQMGAGEASETASTANMVKTVFPFFLIMISIVGAAVFFFFRSRNKPRVTEDHLIKIGRSLFNTTTGVLIIEEQEFELTGKEAALLELLHQQVNNTVKREIILNMVWGDEGDYVGRTLDVFVSKLRKKLEADETVRITNVRGVGYKLVVTED